MKLNDEIDNEYDGMCTNMHGLLPFYPHGVRNLQNSVYKNTVFKN